MTLTVTGTLAVNDGTLDLNVAVEDNVLAASGNVTIGDHDVFFQCAACGSQFYDATQSREASRKRYAPEIRKLRATLRAACRKVPQ